MYIRMFTVRELVYRIMIILYNMHGGIKNIYILYNLCSARCIPISAGVPKNVQRWGGLDVMNDDTFYTITLIC